MKLRHKTYLAIVSALLLGLLAIPTFAAAPDVVNAEVDHNNLSTDEYLTLSVIINQAFGGISEPVLPPLDGFDLIGTSTSTNMSIINGVQSTEKIFMYTLHPTTVGELIIGPVRVNVNGQEYSTTPIRVNVTQGTGQIPSQPSTPSSPSLPGLPSIPGFPSISGLLNQFGLDMSLAEDLTVEQMDPALLPPELLDYEYFVEAGVDNPSPYLGEQITYTFRYYRPVDSVGAQSYQSPDFSGFWVHTEPEENHYGSQFAGRNIRMTEIKNVLLPTMIGEVEIGSAQINSEGDIWNSGFTIQTKPDVVKVQPLPDGAPDGFTGAVGEFSIMAKADTHQTKVNDAVTLTITINGIGNLETFADPEWEIGSQWRAFDSQSATNIQIQEGLIVGERTINQVLVPTMAGDFTIPAIQFSYFDPESGTYQTTATQPIEIHIASDGSVVAPVAITNNPGLVGEMQPIKTSLNSASQPTQLTQNLGFWLLWILPLFLLVGQYGWRKRKEILMKNPDVNRNRKAAKNAYQALKTVDPNSKDYYGLAGRILTTYLSDKLNRSIAGLTQAEISGLLLAHGVSEQLVERVRTCLTISEMGRYAPTNLVNTKEVHLEIKSLISELEAVL